jgi:hypothetical protein
MPLKITPKTFGAAFSAARKRGDKTFEYPPGSGKKIHHSETKEEKDNARGEERSWTKRVGIVKATSVLKPVKLMLTMETPEERGAMNLEGFKRDKKDMEGSGEYSPFKKGGSVKSSASKMGKVKTAKPSMGGASKRADGIAMRGKTRGRMV